MEKQKTAVEFLMMVLQEEFPKQMRDIYESNQLLAEQIAIQAKQMEKEQIIDAYCDGRNSIIQKIVIPAEQYYESKYGKYENKAENND